MFEKVEKESFPDREKRVLAQWQQEEVFEKSVKQREGKTPFSFYDGPPFATGLPHYGHLLAGTIKDVVLRYKTMKGYHAPRRFGWDCHGLPIENEIEKTQGLSGALAIEAYGIDNFNEACRSIVLRYTAEWRQTVERMGRWVDFSKTYRTMDKNFMESVWWVFKELYQKGLVYEGYKVMPFSAKLGTPLSNFEASENYKDVDDPSLTLSIPLEGQDYSVLVWTTTPWTLVSNLALAVHPESTYVEVHHNGKNYVLAKERLAATFKDEIEIKREFAGKELIGKKYQPLFGYFKDHPNAFQIIGGDFVSMNDGVGIVHMAPAFGEDDFYTCKKAGIDPVCPVDQNGLFTAPVSEFAGVFVKDADKSIIRGLKERGFVFNHATIRHRYPFCWRSDTPLIYRAMTTWFVAVEKIKETLIAKNKEIKWMPGHIQEGRFGKWLEGARDWAISRNRYWGTPIPLWRSEDGQIHCIGSVEELEALSGKKIDDLHRHFIDDITFEKEGKTFKRIPEVFDCWFESGSMPYAQNHYPFENKELFDETFPADFIAEGLDQTRGWFYTLHILGCALRERPAFKNVIVNGIVLAEDGNKMSKRLRNYPDPQVVLDKYGADAIRLYMLNSPAVKADDLRFSEKGVELVLRQILIPLWSAYAGFFLTYARIYDWKPASNIASKPENELDRWITSLLEKLKGQVGKAMDAYDLNQAVSPLVDFVDQLTNWYIRRSRRRFWQEEESQDKQEAFQTLYRVLIELSKLLAPFTPFIVDALYSNLRSSDMPSSVHLCDYPEEDKALRDLELEEAMALVQKAVSLGHALRKSHKLRVRQPLQTAFIASSDKKALQLLQQNAHLIADELHVKEVQFTEKEEEFVSISLKPNFRVLGKKVGKWMKQAQEKISAFSSEDIEKIRKKESVKITIEDESFLIGPEDVDVEKKVKEGLVADSDDRISIALDTHLTHDLVIEGLSRELINKISTMRRDMDLEVTDRIVVEIEASVKVVESMQRYQEKIQEEVLAVRMNLVDRLQDGLEWDLNGEVAKIKMSKANS